MSDLKKDEVKWIYEQASLRQDKSNQRMFVIIIILLAITVVTNALWFYRESQFSTEVTTTSIMAEQQADGDSSNYVIGGDYGGETKGISDDDH